MARRSDIRPIVRAGVAAFGLAIMPPLSRLAAAQERPKPVAEFSAGWVGFADDGVVSEGQVGAAFRLYLTPRVSVGPELTFIQGASHSHFMATGTVMCDLVAPTSARARTITPFLAAGGGLFQTRETRFTPTFTSSEGTFTAGGGIRAAAGDRVTIGVDARVGWELHLRMAGVVGVRLGR